MLFEHFLTLFSREIFLANASQCRQAMEQLLVEAFAYQRSKGRGENERDQHKRFGHP